MESGVFGVLALMERRRSHGFSSRKRRHVSNVAPPHASMAQYPTRSIFEQDRQHVADLHARRPQALLAVANGGIHDLKPWHELTPPSVLN